MNKILINAIALAIESHQNTNHKYDRHSYVLHLAMVVNFAMKHINLIEEEYEDDVIAACWLHDTIEDCRLTYNDVKNITNEKVADIVYALTNEKGKNRAERGNEKYYKGIRETPNAIFVKLCDRLANISYSAYSNSKMLDVYRKENTKFLSNLFPKADNEFGDMAPIVNELNFLLEKRTF